MMVAASTGLRLRAVVAVALGVMLPSACGDDAPSDRQPTAGNAGSAATSSMGSADASAGDAPLDAQQGSTGEVDAASSDGASAQPAVGCAPAPATSLLRACLDYVDALCARWDACSDGLEDCHALAQLCPDRLFAEGSSWTLESAHACAQQWCELSCEDVAAGIDPACAHPRGTLAADATCLFDNQCQSGDCEDGSARENRCGRCNSVAASTESCAAAEHCANLRQQSCVDGRCTRLVVEPEPEPPPLGDGENCYPEPRTALPCRNGLRCFGTEEAGYFCRPPPGDGEICGQGPQGGFRICADGLACPRTFGSEDLRCAPPAQLGESCIDQYCDEALWCDDAPRPEGALCVARGAVGDACERGRWDRDDVSQDRCREDLLCLCTDQACNAPRCGTIVDLGAACSLDEGLVCIPGATCIDGRCEPEGPRDLASTCN